MRNGEESQRTKLGEGGEEYGYTDHLGKMDSWKSEKTKLHLYKLTRKLYGVGKRVFDNVQFGKKKIICKDNISKTTVVLITKKKKF